MNADQALQQSDEQAVALLQAQTRSLRGFISRRLRGDTQGAEDIFQACCEELLVYWRSQGGLPQSRAIGSLYTIAKRKLFKWYECQGRDILCPSDDEVLTAYVDESVEDPFCGVVARIDVARALEQLSARQRQALTYVYADELSYQTTAGVMGITVDGVKKLLRTAKRTAQQLPELTGYAPRAREPKEAST